MKLQVLVNGELNEYFKDNKEFNFIARRRYAEWYTGDNDEIDPIIWNNMFCVYKGYFFFEKTVNMHLLKITNNGNGLCVERRIPGYTENEIEVFEDVEEANKFCNNLNIIHFSNLIELEQKMMENEINEIKTKRENNIKKLDNILKTYTVASSN